MSDSEAKKQPKKEYSDEKPAFHYDEKNPRFATSEYQNNHKTMLHKKNHKAYVRDFVDCDYTDKLNGYEKAWMETFLQEAYNNHFKENRVHSDKDKYEIGQANNERRRDSYAMAACGERLEAYEPKENELYDSEDAILERLAAGQADEEFYDEVFEDYLEDQDKE